MAKYYQPEIETMPVEEIKKLQSEKLVKQVQHVYAHVPYYRDLMDKKGVWSLSPAYDVTFSYRKDSIWVNAHQMLINGKSDDITDEDMMKVAEKVGVKKSDAIKCIEQVRASVSKWEGFARQADLSENNIKRIQKMLKTNQ